MPVPFPSIKIDSSENRAIYMTLGYPDLIHTFAHRAPGFGWAFAGQDGAYVTMVSIPAKDLWLGVVVDVKTRFFTQLDFRLAERAKEAEIQ